MLKLGILLAAAGFIVLAIGLAVPEPFRTPIGRWTLTLHPIGIGVLVLIAGLAVAALAVARSKPDREGTP